MESRLRAGRAIVSAALCACAAGCATAGVPVLRHQTGEALGEKHFRLFAHFEMNRVFSPGAAADTDIAGTAQGNSVYQGSFLGLQAEGGVLPKLDLQLGANFTSGGGGWRAGAKYEVLRVGRIAIAGMAGYGVMSGAGDVTYLTSTTPKKVDITLSVWSLDLSVPASVRVANPVWVYGGPLYIHSGVSGSYGGAVVSGGYDDVGFCLGVRVASGIFVGDLEAAEMLVGDPFTDGNRFVPFVGVSFGVTL